MKLALFILFHKSRVAVIGVLALITAYYYYQIGRSNRMLMNEQLLLEKQYTEQQIRFIRMAHTELMEDITTLGFISESVTKLPRGSVFKEGINKLLHSMTKLSQLESLASHPPLTS